VRDRRKVVRSHTRERALGHLDLHEPFARMHPDAIQREQWISRGKSLWRTRTVKMRNETTQRASEDRPLVEIAKKASDRFTRKQLFRRRRVDGRVGSARGGRACSTTAARSALGYTKENRMNQERARRQRHCDKANRNATFFAHTALYENASALSADTRGSQSRMETGIRADGRQEAV
jgi:hypothetical protein